MKKRNKTSLIIAIIAIVLLPSLVGYGLRNSFSDESFKVNTILLKLNMITEGELSTDIRITNQKDEPQIFNLYFSGLEGIASVGENQLALGARGSTIVNVSFKDLKNEVNVHAGYLIVETSTLTKKIPVILTVEDVNPFFTIIQKPLANYDDVSPGGKVGMEIKFFDLKSKESQDINVNYLVKNFEDEILVSEDESLLVKESISVSKIMDIPDNVDEGDYVFITSVNHNGKSIASYFFEISKDKEREFFVGNWVYVTLILAIFFIGIFWLIFRFFAARDKLILQLQKQQGFELRHNLEVIQGYKKELRNIEDIPERRIKLERLEAQRKRVIDKIKSKHERQKDEIKKYIAIRKMHEQEKENGDFKKLREKYEKQKEGLIKLKEKEKRKRVVKELEKKYQRQREKYENQRKLARQAKVEEVKKGMIEKMKDWQKQGYEMSELKTHVKGIPHTRIANQVEAWKKQGYVLK